MSSNIRFFINESFDESLKSFLMETFKIDMDDTIQRDIDKKQLTLFSYDRFPTHFYYDEDKDTFKLTINIENISDINKVESYNFKSLLEKEKQSHKIFNFVTIQRKTYFDKDLIKSEIIGFNEFIQRFMLRFIVYFKYDKNTQLFVIESSNFLYLLEHNPKNKKYSFHTADTLLPDINEEFDILSNKYDSNNELIINNSYVEFKNRISQSWDKDIDFINESPDAYNLFTQSLLI